MQPQVEEGKFENDIFFLLRKMHRFVCSFKPSIKRKNNNKKEEWDDTSHYFSFNKFEKRTSLR
jgi:hypothetical protein